MSYVVGSKRSPSCAKLDSETPVSFPAEATLNSVPASSTDGATDPATLPVVAEIELNPPVPPAALRGAPRNAAGDALEAPRPGEASGAAPGDTLRAGVRGASEVVCAVDPAAAVERRDGETCGAALARGRFWRGLRAGPPAWPAVADEGAAAVPRTRVACMIG